MPFLILRNSDFTYKVINKDTGKIYAYNTKDPKKLIRTIEYNKEKGGIMPITSKLAVEMEHNAYDKTPTNVDGWTLLSPYTLGVKPYIKDNVIVLAIRGSKDMRDVYADIRIANGSLYKSPRYIEDKEFIINLQKQYPQSQYEYYGVGHSLGGAILDLLLNDGLIKEAISYNPAIELKFLKNINNHRIYNESDPLYNIMGKYSTNHEVRKNKLNIFNKIINFTKIGKLKNTLAAHSLSNFDGGVIFY